MSTIAEQIAELDVKIANAASAKSTRHADRATEAQDLDQLRALREDLVRRSQLTTRSRQTFIRMVDE